MTIPVPNAEPSRKHIIDTPDIPSGRNIDSLCRGSGCRSVPSGDVVPQTEPPTHASRKTDLNVHSVPYPEANATYESSTSHFAVNTQK
jgi:hypothetical protein